ncbi:hypothetical protein BU26DRAFT_523380 [Trematosphaeria pertusa]|uniref:Uncharacterized protein n=1 Tax=Trematosphaeria pertusa TaxID=390896 RepID=A0A6A6I0J6_9PLEO|nr:uncharacterized protein BU26DRAFT_523380 [Trematosphaeria pertusa]KAF2243796.1 hypothetical protein BU26DRAFT_523380 [Trematosphaeria pertusa]
MARVAPLHSLAFKRPPRPSLRHIGIPDGGDVLAVYLSWIKQRRSRAQIETAPSLAIASSVRSVVGADEEREPLSPVVAAPFERWSTGFDLRGVGGQFD